jgi:hypothetical protein
MSSIQYAIELITDETGTDTSWGMVAGTFRWITGRPGYDGSAPYPKWEDDTDNTAVWYEGWLLNDGITAPSRRVDITQTGDYGTISGFSFKIRNDEKFWDYIETNEIWLTNRQVKFYVVIDGKFYQAWDGVVSNQPYSETDYEFECVDKFKTVHKEMPPYSINETDNPDADQTSLGETIPIVVGNVQYAKLLKFSNEKKILPFHAHFSNQYYVGNAVNYWTNDNLAWPYSVSNISLVTNNVTYTANALAGKYLACVGGTGVDKERLVRIVANTATVSATNTQVAYMGGYVNYTNISTTLIALAEPLRGCTPGVSGSFAKIHLYKTSESDENTWWFSIVDFEATIAASNNNIGGYNRDERNNILLYTYDKNKNVFSAASDKIQGVASEENLKISIRANGITEDGQIIVSSPIPYLTSRTADNDLDWNLPDNPARAEITEMSTWSWKMAPTKMSPIKGYDYSKITSAYIAPALRFTAPAVNPGLYTTMCMRIKAYDVYGRAMTGEDFDYTTNTLQSKWGLPSSPSSESYWGLIPKDYFAVINAKNQPWISLFADYGGVSIPDDGDGGSSTTYTMRRDLCKISGDLLDAWAEGKVRYIEASVGFISLDRSPARTFYVNVIEMGFWGERSVGTLDEDIYASINGETSIDNVETGTVYGTFNHILKNYDSIAASDLDFDNLPTTRSDWPVSRQITDKKNSYDYLRQLAEHSFVAIFPTRKGQRKLKAWREDEVSVAIHSDSEVLRNSIKSFTKTQIKDIYNQFTLLYHYNIATKKFERSLTVTNVDQALFPDVSDDTWKTYVGGVNPTSYADAKAIWEICRDAYTKSKAIQKAPDTISNLYWYADQNASGSIPSQSPGVSVDNSPWKFLVNLAEWSTRQKDIVTYSLPLTSANIVLELLDHIDFSDTIYTNSIARPGWITSISIDPKKDSMQIEATLDPIELQEDAVIIERGVLLNEDTITDGINQTDTVEETP